MNIPKYTKPAGDHLKGKEGKAACLVPLYNGKLSDLSPLAKIAA